MELSRCAAPAAVLGLALSCTNLAQASFVLTISNDFPDDVVVSDNLDIGFFTDSGLETTVADGDPTEGIISFNGSVGEFVVNVTTGISAPVIGPGRLQLSTVDVSGGAGLLTISLTDTDYTGVVPQYKAEVGGTTDGTVFFGFRQSNTNEEFSGSGIDFDLVGPGAFSVTDTLPAQPGTPYSLEIGAEIFHPGADQITSFGALLTPVPVPAAVWLFGSGLLGLLGIARRKAA